MNQILSTIKKSMYAAVFLFVLSFIYINSPGSVNAAAKSFSALKAEYPDGSLFTKSYKNKAWQCHAFACTIGDSYAGSDPYTWNKVYNLNSLKPGDIIRCSRPHSIIVTSVSGDTVTYADCNWTGKNKVKWDQTISRSRITGKFGSLSYVMSAPKVNNTVQDSSSVSNQPKPSITNIGIDSIDFWHVDFHFTANNAGMARVVIQSRNTGKSVTSDYTSGLSYVSHSFNISDFPGTTELNVLIYAYSTINGGDETLHRLLYGNIPGVVQLPEGDPEIASLCFDHVYYADNNADLKAAYGYNQEKLYNHWINFGLAEGRASSPVWDGKYYLKANQDVAKAYNNDCALAYKHFLTYGYKELRTSSCFYDGRYYQNKYRAELGSFDGKQLLFHFRNFGMCENRAANESAYTGFTSWKEDAEIAAMCFDHIYYADQNSDLKASYGYDREKLYEHWVRYGIEEGRAGSPVWDGAYYLKANQDVAKAYNNDCLMAYKHFLVYGCKELRESSKYYSGGYYRNKYSGELGKFSGKELLSHFCNYGFREKRQANTSMYVGNTSWK